eukprot:CAMPEP_0114496442 /NCGR_PEP_ID=MMETSP0109-20121206/5772_1 /TAXON_ID=29199 /ORGANISM="Chlorarachnion reptans, Strain CCCM449" /LENGTH=61 /DNA_ID=CAMNT_0001673715 /DNA_START=223 /DNA_END=408 /DNA_ORIENTATION=-
MAHKYGIDSGLSLCYVSYQAPVAVFHNGTATFTVHTPASLREISCVFTIRVGIRWGGNMDK